MTRTLRTSLSITLAALLCGAAVVPVHADRHKARSSVNHSDSRNVNRNTNVNRNSNVNRNTNVNRNVNRDVDIDIDRDIDIDVDHHHGCCYSGGGAFVAGAVVGAAVTAAVIGSTVYTLPPACTVVIVNGLAYQQCGTVWYQPQFVGTTQTYIVVNAPR